MRFEFLVRGEVLVFLARTLSAALEKLDEYLRAHGLADASWRLLSAVLVRR